jgi:hypothetical protein
MPNLSAQLMNHFHSRTTIDDSAPTFEMPQQTTTSLFEHEYTHVAPSFAMLNPSSDPYTLGVMVKHTRTPMTLTKSSTSP